MLIAVNYADSVADDYMLLSWVVLKFDFKDISILRYVLYFKVCIPHSHFA